jgi:hypothetical protein
LFGSHLSKCQLCTGIARVSCSRKPVPRPTPRQLYAGTFEVTQSKVVLRPGITESRSTPIPSHSLSIVTRSAHALMQQDAEVSGRIRVAGLSRQLQPPPSGWRVLPRAHTIPQAQPEVVGRATVSMLSSTSIPLDRQGRMGHNAATKVVASRQVKLGSTMPRLRSALP